MKTEGIVLSETDYKESSKIVNLYTPHGKMGVKALGSKRVKNGELGFTTTGNTVEFIAGEGMLPSLVEYTILDSMYSKMSDIKVAKAFSLIIKLINEIPEDADHKRIYPFIKNIISSFGSVETDKLVTVFLVKMLYSFGVNPELKGCIRCKKKENLFFSVASGGTICKECGQGDASTYPLWLEYYYGKKNLKDYSDCDFELFLKEIKEYYSYHLGLGIKY